MRGLSSWLFSKAMKNKKDGLSRSPQVCKRFLFFFGHVGKADDEDGSKGERRRVAQHPGLLHIVKKAPEPLNNALSRNWALCLMRKSFVGGVSAL
jgi:hypothetical protein